MANAGESVCHNDPNFSVICSFLDKYSELLGLPPISFQDLQRYLEDTKDVSKVLIDLHVWLLRRIGRHSVTAERLDRSLIKFCHWFSDVDAWEVERFGYKHSKLSTKLRILKNLLECQFDNNVKFKDKINDIEPEKMRFHPIGRDKNGMAYWYLLDQDYNVLVYRDEQDDVDDETWELVCKDRNDLASLITDLAQNKELSNKPDETSSSNKSSKEGSPEAEDRRASMKSENEGCMSEVTSQSDLKMTIKLERLSEKDIQIAKEQKVKTESENNENSRVKPDIEVKEESPEENIDKTNVEEENVKDDLEVKTENNEESKTNCIVKSELIDQKKIDDLENVECLNTNKTVSSDPSKSETESLVKEEKPDGELKEEKVAPDKCEPNETENNVEKETLSTNDAKLTSEDVVQDSSIADSASPKETSEITQSDNVSHTKESPKIKDVNELSEINDNNSSNANEIDSTSSVDQTVQCTESLKVASSNQNGETCSVLVDSNTTESKDEETVSEVKSDESKTPLEQDDETKTITDTMNTEQSTTAEAKENSCDVDCNVECNDSKQVENTLDSIQESEVSEDKSISKENESLVTVSESLTDTQNKDKVVSCNKKKVKASKKGKKKKSKAKSIADPSVENELKENHDVNEKPEMKDDAVDVSESSVPQSVQDVDKKDEADDAVVKEKDSSEQQANMDQSCDTVKPDSKTKNKQDETETSAVTDSTSRPVSSTRKRAAKASTDEQVAAELGLTRSRRSTRQSSSQKEKVNVNGVTETKKADAKVCDVKDNGKRVKRKAEVKDMNGKEDSNEKGETSSDDDTVKESAKGAAKQKESKSSLKRSAAEIEYKEPAEKKARRGRGTRRAGASRVRAKRKVAVSEESSDSSDSDDVPLSVIKGQDRTGRGARATKGRVRQRGKKDESDLVSSCKKLGKSKKTKSSGSGTSDESDEPAQKNQGRGSTTKRKAPVEHQESDNGVRPRRSLRACVARSKLVAESLSEEEQPSSSEASIETPSPTDSDDEDFFCPKGRNAQRVAARIESKAFQPGPDDTPCCRCQLCDHPEWMLLCDKCDAGYHTACLRPPIMIIPDGDWFCPPCEHKFLIEKLQEQLASLDVFLKKKARLVKRKERLAFVGISLDNILKEDRKKSFILREEFEEEDSPKTFVPKSRRDRRKERDYDFEPLPEEVYAKRSCRTRKTMNYNFTEYDELINSAIQEDIKDVDLSQPPGIGRGKDMSNIMLAGEEEEEGEEGEEGEEEEVPDGKPPPVLSHVTAIKKLRKGRRLTQLDSDDNDDDSEEFQLSEESVSEASQEEVDDGASEESEDWRPGQASGRRSTRKSSRSSKGKWSRWSRFNTDFVVDDDYESDDSANNRRSTRSKTKRQVNYRELNSDESEAVETSESEESANLSELCSEDSDKKSKKTNRRVIRSDSEDEETEPDSQKQKEILPHKKPKKKLNDSESSTNEESSAEETVASRPRRKSAVKVNFKEDEETSSEGPSDSEAKPKAEPVKKAKPIKKKNVLNSDSESEDEAMDSKNKSEKKTENDSSDAEDSDSKQDVTDATSADTQHNVLQDEDTVSKSVLPESEESKTFEKDDKTPSEDKLLSSQQTHPPSNDGPPPGFSEVPEGHPAYMSPGESYGPQGQPDYPHSYGKHHPYMHPQYGAPPGTSFPQGQHAMPQRSPHQMSSPPHPHVSPQHMQGSHPQGTPPHGMQHPIMGSHGPQQAPYPGGPQHRPQGYYVQGGQQRVPGPQSMMGPCGSPPHAPHTTPPQHPPHGTPPHMGTGHSHISPPHHPNPPSGPGPMQHGPPPHPHQYGPYPNMYGPPQGPYPGSTVHPRPGMPPSTGPHMSPPISQMSIPTSQHMPPSIPSHHGQAGHPQLNGPSRHMVPPHHLNGPPSHNFQTLQRPNVPPQGQPRPPVPQESRNLSDPTTQEVAPRHSAPVGSRGPQLTTMTDAGGTSGSRGFMMDNLLKDNGQPRKEPTGEDDDLEDVSDIVNYVMNDDYFKDHT